MRNVMCALGAAVLLAATLAANTALAQGQPPFKLLFIGALLADAVPALGTERHLLSTVAGCAVRLVILPPVFFFGGVAADANHAAFLVVREQLRCSPCPTN